MGWKDEIQDAQSLKNCADFESFSKEAEAEINFRISHASTNLAQHQFTFEVIVSLLVALDSSVPKTNTALAPAPPSVGLAGAPTSREVEWMQERTQFTTGRMNDLERKIALQDQMLERIMTEQEVIDALPPLHSLHR